MTYKVYAVRVFSSNWAESLEFYKNMIGFPLSFADENLEWAQFDVGSTYLGLERCDSQDPECEELVGRFVGLSIEVRDIDSTYENLTAKGVKFTGPPEKQTWGGTLAHFIDPDNNVITLLGGSDA